MFVCDPCLRKYFTNDPSFMQSRGPCEMCRRSSVCSDIPSIGLRNRSKPRKKSVPKKATPRKNVRTQASVKPTPLDRMESALKGEKD